jgi:hypothetical protein
VPTLSALFLYAAQGCLHNQANHAPGSFIHPAHKTAFALTGNCYTNLSDSNNQFDIHADNRLIWFASQEIIVTLPT